MGVKKMTWSNGTRKKKVVKVGKYLVILVNDLLSFLTSKDSFSLYGPISS